MRIRSLPKTLLLFILALSLWGHDSLAAHNPPATTAPITLDLTASKWTQNSVGVIPLTNCCNGALTFNFPTDDANHDRIGYLYQTIGSARGKKHTNGMDLSTYHSIYMRIQVVVTGTPTFNWVFGDPTNTCPDGAKLHPYFATNIDTNRWWANPIFFLLPASSAVVDITVPLTPDQWSDVNGQMGTVATAEWSASIRNVGDVGMTFGGGCWAGHGLNINPGATYQLLVLNYQIL